MVDAGLSRALPSNLAMSNVTPATRLLEKRRQMFEVQEALETQKKEFARKDEAFRRREEELKRRDLELQESLIRFSKFLQENDSKRARAEKKAANEARARIAKDAEIAKLAEVLEGLGEERERVGAVVERRMRYQRYLEAVLEVAGEYQDVGELLARHATLQATNADLRAHEAACDAAAEAERAALASYVKARGDELLLLNNELARLKAELEGQERDAGLLEAAKDGALMAASQRVLAYGQVVLAADNLYGRCRARSHIAHAAVAGPLQQLEVVGAYVSDLVAACRLAQSPDQQQVALAPQQPAPPQHQAGQQAAAAPS